MTIEDVIARLKEIDEIKGDDESAHSLEDRLRADVLEAIADGAEHPELLAHEVLKTQYIEFSRWCA